MLSKAMHELLGQVEELARFANTPVGMARAVMHQICVVGVMCPLWRRLGKFIKFHADLVITHVHLNVI